MKKSTVNSWNVDDAVQDGINEFGRLSGYTMLPVASQKTSKKKHQPIMTRLPMLIAAVFLKLLK